MSVVGGPKFSANTVSILANDSIVRQVVGTWTFHASTRQDTCRAVIFIPPCVSIKSLYLKCSCQFDVAHMEDIRM